MMKNERETSPRKLPRRKDFDRRQARDGNDEAHDRNELKTASEIGLSLGLDRISAPPPEPTVIFSSRTL